MDKDPTEFIDRVIKKLRYPAVAVFFVGLFSVFLFFGKDFVLAFVLGYGFGLFSLFLSYRSLKVGLLLPAHKAQGYISRRFVVKFFLMAPIVYLLVSEGLDGRALVAGYILTLAVKSGTEFFVLKEKGN